jgi:hypothetical protein
MSFKNQLEESKKQLKGIMEANNSLALETNNPTALGNSPISLAAISALEAQIEDAQSLIEAAEKDKIRGGNSFGSTSKHKTSKRKTSKHKTSKRKTSKHKSRKRKTSKRKSRKSRKRKTSKRKSRKRKTSKRKSRKSRKTN